MISLTRHNGTTQSGVRATARPPVCILQARGGGAIPEVALWTIERFDMDQRY